MSAGRILVVDDDPQIRRVMRTTLSAHGYEVSDTRSSEEALEKLRAGTYDLVLLDMNMPGMGGIEACRAIRQGSDVAIIMLTVRNTEKDKVEALDAGADDYVTKPFSSPELLARIRSALRRTPSSGSEPRRISLEGVEIDFESRRVRVRDREVRLTPKEFDLLRYLITHSNKVIAHRELLQAVWGADYGDELEYLRVFVNRLRRKIEPNPAEPRYLLTEAWVGYRFHLPEQELRSPFLLASVEVAREIKRIIEPHLGFHEIFFCEVWDENNPPKFEQPREQNFLGYDIASCGGEFWSIILHGLFELEMEVRGSTVELNPDPSLVSEYKSLLNEHGLFSSTSCVPEYIRRYKEEVQSDANASFCIYRLVQVK